MGINKKFQKDGHKVISKIIIKCFICQALKNPKDYIKTYDINIINNKEKIFQSFKYLNHIFNVKINNNNIYKLIINLST